MPSTTQNIKHLDEGKAPRVSEVSCVDLFCGVGGLTHGFVLEGLPVVAGIDVDAACRYPYEANNGAQFIEKDIGRVTGTQLKAIFGAARWRILAGCAPCQPFSSYSQRYDPNPNDGKWRLLYRFGHLVRSSLPDVVTMENVPSIERHSVFSDFVHTLDRRGYDIWYDVVDSSKYGVPQLRKRLVLLASLHGPIEMLPPTHKRVRTVRQAIGKLRPIDAGEISRRDKLHSAASLSNTNLMRIRASRPGGSWRDWPEDLVAKCHRSDTGRSYPGVYGRMEWDRPSPTITTQCYGFGSGRFGHPEQDRAISLREAALLQSFPRNYAFIPKDGSVVFKELGRLIGNAVPVYLSRAIAKSIKRHIEEVEATDRRECPA